MVGVGYLRLGVDESPSPLEETHHSREETRELSRLVEFLEIRCSPITSQLVPKLYDGKQSVLRDFDIKTHIIHDLKIATGFKKVALKAH
tara:strand:+ start:358 stop:624 length:267 start_codon:yes stop_codon:yes gene_type:complete